jgi:hypothetical protein
MGCTRSPVALPAAIQAFSRSSSLQYIAACLRPVATVVCGAVWGDWCGQRVCVCVCVCVISEGYGECRSDIRLQRWPVWG